MDSAPTLRAIQGIADGYAFTGPALDLGAVLMDGTAYPNARVRIPLGVLNRHGLVFFAAGGRGRLVADGAGGARRGAGAGA